MDFTRVQHGHRRRVPFVARVHRRRLVVDDRGALFHDLLVGAHGDVSGAVLLGGAGRGGHDETTAGGAAAAAAVPGAAFVPAGGRHGHSVAGQHAIGEQVQHVLPPAETRTASFVAGIVGVGAAAFATMAAQQRRKTARRMTTLEMEEYLAPKPTEWPDPKKRYSESVPFLVHPKQLDGWVGGEKGFDPLGTTDAIPVYIMREAELKHGRVCMLATIGWIATDLGARFPAQVFQDATTLTAHDAAVEAGYMQQLFGIVGSIEAYGLWLLFKGWGGDIKRDAGDFFLGKNFLPKDLKQADEMRAKEIENGRLAMLAFSGIVTQAAAFQAKWPFLDV